MAGSFGGLRVDGVPWPLRPLVALYGVAGAIPLLLIALALRATVRVHIVGGERLHGESCCIFCYWHEAMPLSIVCGFPKAAALLPDGRHAWLQHPLVYMKPIHLLLRMLGAERIVLGSTGHAGRQGADELVSWLKRGYSTVILPDGPHGPPRALKPGVLHLAAQSGVPVVPVRFAASHAIRLPTWDRKQFPFPFSTITMTIGYPCRVSGGEFEAARGSIVAALG